MAMLSIFIFSEQKDTQLLKETAHGYYKVVFVCVEIIRKLGRARQCHIILGEGLIRSNQGI